MALHDHLKRLFLSFAVPSEPVFKVDVSQGDFRQLVLAGLSSIAGGGAGGAGTAPASPATAVTSKTVTSSANAAAVITLAAVAGKRNSIAGSTIFSYSAAPTGGRLTVLDGATTLFDADVPGTGPHQLPLVFTGTANTAMTITLAAGGGAVVGKLNVSKTWTE